MANSMKWPSDDRVLNGDHSRYPTYIKIEPPLRVLASYHQVSIRGRMLALFVFRGLLLKF